MKIVLGKLFRPHTTREGRAEGRLLGGRLSAESAITLFATLLFLFSIFLVSAVQLYYARSEMRTVLAEQQRAFVARVADDLDQKLLLHRDFIETRAKTIPPELIGNPDELQKWMEERRGLQVFFGDLFIISSKGILLADVPPKQRRGLDLSDREYVRVIVETRKAYISKPLRGRVTNQPSITFAAPAFGKDGSVIAILAGSLNLLQPNFLGHLAEAPVGRNGSFAVFTHDRTILISRDKSRILTQGPPSGASPYFDRATAGLEGSEEEVNSRGLRAIFTYSQLKAAPWTLVAALPIEEANAPIEATQKRMLQAALLLALFVGPLVWVAVRTLYDPLHRALGATEARYRAIFEQVAVGVAHSGVDGGFIDVNPRFCEISGYSREEALQLGIRDITHPDFLASSVAAREDLLAGKRPPYERETRLRRKDGTYLWAHITTSLVKTAAGGAQHFTSVIQDISERKGAETRIRRLNRVYAVLSHINTLIVRVRDRDELLREATRIAVDEGGFVMAWAGLVDDERSVVKPVAAAGAVGDFFGAAPMDILESQPGGHGMTGRAVRSRMPMISNDVVIDTQRLMKKELAERGISSLAIIPLVVGGEAVGVLAFYAAEAGFFDEEEMRLLQELAGDVSFGLDHIVKAEKLEYLAYYDPLTGLANRSLFLERLGQKLLDAGTAQRKVTVWILDVERFKSINDAFGRQAGDRLLQDIATRMKDLARDAARLARVGPDQIAVLRDDMQSEDEIARFSERRLQDIFGQPYRVADQDLRISGRYGIALSPADGRDAESLMRSAEAALKKAKATGERYVFFAQEMTERIHEKLALESRLRQALEKDEFVLHYQPKVDAETRKVLGAEALIRWQSAEGLVPPLKFIPLMEETGMIREAGAWALRRAVLDHRHWLRMGLTGLRVAVNVSPIQLRRQDFVETVKEAIAQGANPTGLDLEITESLIMEDVQGNIRKLKAIRDLGVSVAIDDFGTGYSSLAYLAKLPVETLKIDRSFVVGMLNDPNTMMLIQTMIALAHSLRLKVVAEGVETEEQARMLRLLRCDVLQGYLISKPAPIEEIIPLLRKAS